MPITRMVPAHLVRELGLVSNVVDFVGVVGHEGGGMEGGFVVFIFVFEFIVKVGGVFSLFGFRADVPFFVMPPPDFVDGEARDNG